MKRKCLEESSCPIARAMDQIGDWWSLLIISHTLSGPRRFTDLQQTLKIPKNILASRLRQLTQDGIITTESVADSNTPGPARAHKRYTLTEKGKDLYIVLAAIRQWSQKHLPGSKPSALPGLVDSKSRRAIRPIVMLAHDGTPLGPDDISQD